jgi:hypothetical protein
MDEEEKSETSWDEPEQVGPYRTPRPLVFDTFPGLSVMLPGKKLGETIRNRANGLLTSHFSEI